MAKLAYNMYKRELSLERAALRVRLQSKSFRVIAGTSKLRESFERGDSLESIHEAWQGPLAEFGKVRQKYLLY